MWDSFSLMLKDQNYHFVSVDHFLNNSADYGGGILLYYSTSSDYTDLENSNFIAVIYSHVRLL